MNKQKFEAYLRDKLSILQEEEIDEIVAEYLQHIDMRVAEGVSEEEAIADFGDLDELVNDLLDAYKINRNERDFEKFENRVKLGLNNVMDFINQVASAIMKRSSNGVVTLIVEFLIVILAVYLLNSFIEAVFDGLYSAFYFRPYFLTNLIRLLIGLIRVVLTTSVSLAIFYWFAKERVIKNAPEDREFKDSEKKQSESPVKENVKSADLKNDTNARVVITPEVLKAELDQDEEAPLNKQDVIDVEVVEEVSQEETVKETEKTTSTVDKNEFEQKTKAKPVEIIKPKKQKSFMQKVLDVNILIVRVIVAICLIPAIVVGVFMGIGYGMLIYATVLGFGSIGLLILFTGILLIYYYFTIIFIKFVGGKKA